ncbi:helix-turn-helix domain-containing protein [Acrocarpospora sp. B8E8]|uniref:winged helix-turn-helix transcriptional regulator n=1 Tax=Acrocarpospora sp. B8E8 TaxID=3153572 RepID=UPI00325FA8F5
MHTTYGQFCPVALGAEVFAERWTPLILRELLNGSHRFNDLHRGLPRISRALLAQRLVSLERAGLLERRPGPEYHLTDAGQALRPVIEALGHWGYRFVASELRAEHLDAGLLMWFVRRRLRTENLPAQRTVVQFQFRPRSRPPAFWLILRPPDADLCITDPGLDIDLYVDAELRAMAHVFLGRLSLSTALREGYIELNGSAQLRHAFPTWIGISPFATTQGRKS